MLRVPYGFLYVRLYMYFILSDIANIVFQNNSIWKFI